MILQKMINISNAAKSRGIFVFRNAALKRFINTVNKRGVLKIDPPSCLFYEPVQIKCTGLRPKEDVTLTNSTTTSDGRNWISISHFRSDESGDIDLCTSSSLGGDFEGVFPMGPISTLRSTEKGKYRVSFIKRNIKPMNCKIRILEGHVDEELASNPDDRSIIAEESHERTYVAPGVQEIDVRVGRIRGKLFIPPGDGPFPGVVDMHGVGTDLNSSRACLLASQGIASLALAYLYYDDLPKAPKEFDLSYFEEAVQHLLSHPKVMKPHVGAIGMCLSAPIACAMGIFIEEVTAVITLGGIPVVAATPLRVNQKIFTALPYFVSRKKVLDDGVANILDGFGNSDDYPGCKLPLEDAEADFLFLVGKEDGNWKSEEETLKAVERVKAKGKSNCQTIVYPGVGHFINPPYSPLVRTGYHSAVNDIVLFGGSAKDICEAQIHAWNTILEFLNFKLRKV